MLPSLGSFQNRQRPVDRKLMSGWLPEDYGGSVGWGKLQEWAVGSDCLVETRVSLCGGANVLELDTVVMVVQHHQCILGATG